jgi:ferredoxin
MDDDGKSTLIGSEQKKILYQKEITADEVEANKKAAKDCPVHIIRVIE